MRRLCAVAILGLTWAATASAQSADCRFHWKTGQTLFYRVEHTTDVTEVVEGKKEESKSKVNLIKKWQVTAVDGQGVATVQMSITVMRNEQTRANGDVLLFDSRAPEKSNAALRDQLTKYVGQTLAVLRVDGRGKVVEVKQGAANRFQTELPFTVLLPPNPVSVGLAWERDYAITLDAPLGSGETHAAQQKYVCTKVDGPLMTFSVATVLAKMPESKAQQLPLLQKLPEGEAVFDVAHGRLHSAHLVIDRQIQGHQGESSSYRFQSTYSELFAE